MKNSIKVRYIISFLLVMLVPITLFAFFFYIINLNNINIRIKESNLTSFSQATTQINYLFKEMSNVALYISTGTENITVANSALNDSRIISDLRAYSEKFKYDVELYYYTRGDKYIYNYEGREAFTNFVSGYDSSTNLSHYGFFGRLNKSISPMILGLFPHKNVPEKSSGYITYIFPIPFYKALPDADILFMVNGSEIENAFISLMGDFDGTISIFNNNMESVYEKNVDEGMMKEIYRLRGIGPMERSINGQKYIFLRGVAEDNSLVYVVGMKESEFYKEATDVKKQFALVMTFLVLICIMLALVLAFYNYNPIKKLTSFVTGDENPPGDLNEIDIIKRFYQSVMDRNDKLCNQVNIQSKMVENQCILRLLRGNYKDENEINYYLSCAQISFKNPYFVVISIVFPFEESAQILKNTILENFMGIYKIKDGGIFLHESVGDNTLVIIVNLSRNTAGTNILAAQDIYALCMGWGAENIVLGVGGIYDKLSNINKSFIESMTALQTIIPNKMQRIYYYSEHNNIKMPANELTLEHSLLIESIKHGDKKVAVSELERLLQTISSEQKSFLLIQVQCFNILKVILSLVSSMKIEIEIFNLDSSYIFSSLVEFREKFIPFVELLCEKIELSRNNMENEIKRSILDYIHLNYCESSISLESVSGRFKISKSNLNLLLKMDTGYTFAQYVAMLRLKEVKRQLAETEQAISAIIRSVGYLDVANFTRKFKKVEGITPMQYRQLNKSEDVEALFRLP